MTATIAIGTIPGWLTLAALAVLGYFIVRGSGGQALTVLEAANRILTKRIADLENDLLAAKTRIAELEQTHTMEPILTDLRESKALMQAEHKAIMEGLAANTTALKVLESSLQGLAMLVHARGDSGVPGPSGT